MNTGPRRLLVDHNLYPALNPSVGFSIKEIKGTTWVSLLLLKMVLNLFVQLK